MVLNKLKFFQANLHHSKSAVIEVNNTLPVKCQTILMLQEPYLRNNKGRNFNLRKFNLFVKVSSDKPRTCILATKDCELILLSQLSSGDLTVVSMKMKINGGERLTILAPGYMPSESNILPPSPEVINLVNYSKSKNLPLIFSCDSNSHHTVWGSTDINVKGESLLEFIISSNLMVLNRGDEPTIYNSIREEVLDLRLTTISFAHMIKDWKVTNKILTSDHKCISFHINTDRAERMTFRNPANTDWEKFKDSLMRSLPDVDLLALFLLTKN